MFQDLFPCMLLGAVVHVLNTKLRFKKFDAFSDNGFYLCVLCGSQNKQRMFQCKIFIFFRTCPYLKDERDCSVGILPVWVPQWELIYWFSYTICFILSSAPQLPTQTIKSSPAATRFDIRCAMFWDSFLYSQNSYQPARNFKKHIFFLNGWITSFNMRAVFTVQ